MLVEFKGIKYSPTTDIFYKFVKGELHRFSIFKDTANSSTRYKWIPSDFQDLEGKSSTWVDATEAQIVKEGL